MFKKLFFCGMVLFLGAYSSVLALYSPQNTVFVFDVNDVLIDAQKKPIPDTLGYIDILYAQSYQQFIFSNVGVAVLTRLQESCPQFKNCFAGMYTKKTIPDFINKKLPGAFKKLVKEIIAPVFKQKYGLLPTMIVYVDDNPDRLETAQQGLDELQAEDGAFRVITLKTITYTVGGTPLAKKLAAECQFVP